MPRYVFDVHDGRDVTERTASFFPTIRLVAMKSSSRPAPCSGISMANSGAPEWHMEIKN